MCFSFKVLLLIVYEEIVARTDGQTAEITTISPRFSKSVAPTPAPTEARVRQTTRPARVAGGGAEASRRSRGGVAARRHRPAAAAPRPRETREYPGASPVGPRLAATAAPPRPTAARRDATTPGRTAPHGSRPRVHPGPAPGRGETPGAGEPAADPGTVDARRPWRRRGCMGSDVSSLESGAFLFYLY